MLSRSDQDRRMSADRREVSPRRQTLDRRMRERRLHAIPVDVDWRMGERRSGAERRTLDRRSGTDRRDGLNSDVVVL